MTDKTTIHEALTKIRELMSEENPRKAQHQSKFHHVNWNRDKDVWQVQLSVHGTDFYVACAPFAEDECAGRPISSTLGTRNTATFMSAWIWEVRAGLRGASDPGHDTFYEPRHNSM